MAMSALVAQGGCQEVKILGKVEIEVRGHDVYFVGWVKNLGPNPVKVDYWEVMVYEHVHVSEDWMIETSYRQNTSLVINAAQNISLPTISVELYDGLYTYSARIYYYFPRNGGWGNETSETIGDGSFHIIEKEAWLEAIYGIQLSELTILIALTLGVALIFILLKGSSLKRMVSEFT
jgi:hypothetical protein